MMISSEILLLEYEPCEAQVVSPCASPVQRRLEAAGHSFQEFWRDRCAAAGEAKGKAKGKGKAQEKTTQDADYSAGAYAETPMEKALFVGDGEDYYELLGLGDIRHAASQDQIRKAYRRLVLRYHPDKQQQTEKEASAKGAKTEDSEAPIDDTAFKKLQKAYDVLSDIKKRKAYDSVDDFDESIPSPSDVTTPESFYVLYGPVFRRNARWSENKPVPMLGDESSGWETVEAFYTFWNNFKSWRDFSACGEHDTDQAESREERRWMERENAREVQKRKKAEHARLIKLVEDAFRLDPRVQRQRAEEKAEKERKKKEKEDARRKIQEEKERAEAEAKEIALKLEQQKKEEEAAEKASKAKSKKQMTRERQRLRAFFFSSWNENAIQVEKVCSDMDLASLESLCDALSLLPPDTQKTKLNEAYLSVLSSEEQAKFVAQQRLAAEKAAEVSAVQESAWTPEELSLLAKAVAKFPGGYRNRWEAIARHCGATRTPDQCMAKAKQLASDQRATEIEAANAFALSQAQKKKTEVVLPPPDVRSQLFGAVHIIPTPATPEPAPAPAPAPATPSKPAEASTSTPQSKPAPKTAKSAPASSEAKSPAPKSEITAEAPAESTRAAAPTPAPAPAATAAAAAAAAAPAAAPTTAPKVVAVVPAGEWSAAQQRALEDGLRAHPASDPERWDKISALVAGKDKAQCQARFKELRELLKKAKA